MPGKPTSFPAAQEAVEHFASQAQEHIPDVFTFAATATAEAIAAIPDLSDPPGSVLAEVLAGVEPHATIDFPDAALDAIAQHANLPPHVLDWFV